MTMSDIDYARAGDTHIAYRVIGVPGRVDVVMVAGALFPLELLEEDRISSRFTAGLAALGRLVIFDKRGIGLSDPMTDWSRSAQEQWAEDLVAVIEAADLDHPVVVSWEQNGVARFAASERPDLFASMVLINPSQSTRPFSDLLVATSGQTLPSRSVEELAFPSRIKDPEFADWLSRSGRAGASPTSASRLWAHLLDHEGPLTPPGITTQTLVLHNRECLQAEDEVRAVADAISGASFVQVAGADTFPIAGDVDLLITEIAEFVTGAPSGLTPLRHISRGAVHRSGRLDTAGRRRGRRALARSARCPRSDRPAMRTRPRWTSREIHRRRSSRPHAVRDGCLGDGAVHL